MKYLKLFLIPLFLASCDSKPKEEEVKSTFMGSEELPVIPRVNTYKDKDGVEWHRNNIFAPRENESVDDPEYRKRMGFDRGGSSNPYRKGYEEGFEDAMNGEDSRY